MADKQIRFNVEGADRVAAAYDVIRRKQEEITNLGRKTSKEEQDDLNRRLKALKELHRQQEQNYRDELNLRQLAAQQDALAIREYQQQRAEQSKSLRGDKRKKFDEDTQAVVEEYQRNDIRERQQTINLRREYQEQRQSNKKQIDEIRNVSETIRGEGTKTRRDNGEVISRISSGGMTMMGGNLGNMIGGLLRFAGPAAAVGMLASAVINQTKERQNALTGFAASSDLSNTEAVYRSAALRNPSLGLDAITASNKAVMYSRSSGLDLMRSGTERDIFGIAGLQIARGFSDQQIQQLLAIQRYSGNSIFGQTNTLEEFTRRRDGNIVKLPEILDQYLRVANEILNRTGRLDASSIQQVLTSVSSSYGLSGVPLDRMSSGIMNLGKDQGSGIMRAFRMETLRKMYPSMSTWDMVGIMEDPTRDPKYLQEIVNRSKKMGGGGDWTKFFLMSQGFSYSEVDKLMKGDFKLSEMSYGKSDDKMLQNKYLTEGESKVGNIQQLETSIGALTDSVVKITSAILDGDLKTILFTMATPLGSVIATAINDHLNRRN